ncbi:MAG: histidinol-phosphate transaminase [Desulfobaccales bacterium]
MKRVPRPEPKKLVADLYRTQPPGYSRHDYLRLDMNEAVPGLPEDFVQRTLASVTARYLATYPEYRGLQAKIAVHNGLLPEQILLSNGSDGAIKYIFEAYVSPGDEVLLTDPTFAMYAVYCRMFGARPVWVEYRSDLSFPWEEFLDRLSGVRLAVVVNPNNPTGYALPPAQLLKLIEHAARQEILLLIDEAYFYYYPETAIQRVNDFQNLIVLRTFSKLCGMAALRLGYAAACPEVIEVLRRVRPTFDVNGLAVHFGESLLAATNIIPELLREVKAGKEFLVRKLSEAGIPHCPGSANFVLIDCRGKVEAVVKGLAEAKILVGAGFKNDFLKDYIRVTVGSKAVMQRFWQGFAGVWGRLDVESCA